LKLAITRNQFHFGLPRRFFPSFPVKGFFVSDILGVQPLIFLSALASWPGAEGAAFMAGRSVNKVILIGNLGKDPEVKYTQGGMPVAKFSIATNERFKDKEGQWQDRTEWHNIVAFQRLAEIVGEYLKKGGKCFIEGSLRTSSWDDKETGQKKYKTEIIANDLVLLSGRGEGAGDDSGGRSRGASAGGNNFDQRTPEPEHAAASTPISDDDIPF
jgi:single-strand DNA-binding protein